jgi:hypothetical protein
VLSYKDNKLDDIYPSIFRVQNLEYHTEFIEWLNDYELTEQTTAAHNQFVVILNFIHYVTTMYQICAFLGYYEAITTRRCAIPRKIADLTNIAAKA